MPGRPSKPVQLIKLEGNRDRRTKAELEYREKMEKSLRTGAELKPTDAVKADPIAFKEFKRLKKLYSSMAADFVDALDIQMVNRYCLLISQEQKMVQEGADFNALHKLREQLIKMEDRLFLNPASRIKAIPKKPPEQEKKSPMAQFLSRRTAAGGGNAT